MELSSFDQFILKHQLELTKDDWKEISEKYELCIDMIRVLQNKLDWEKIAKFQTLDIITIEEFINYQLKDYISIICKYQVLTEEFVDKYKHLVDWEMIIKHQYFSIEFILNHSEDIKKVREW